MLTQGTPTSLLAHPGRLAHTLISKDGKEMAGACRRAS